MCSGYYKYAHGYEPEFEGSENFEGQIIHPQKWSEDVEYENKEVVVIGSGATAATLVPELAKKRNIQLCFKDLLPILFLLPMKII